MKHPSWQQQIERDFVAQFADIPNEKIHVGFSGGLDSTLLLTMCTNLIPEKKIIAIHVNHQLSPFAVDWQKHCESICVELGCDIVVRTVAVANSGAGVEAAARSERYRVFSEVVEDQGLLLLGHHLDDQVETFFLRLFRGSGLHGLQAIAKNSQRDHYQLIRPFLGITRSQIETLGHALNLRWIEDESNNNLDYDRNFLRHQVLPLIEQRWPQYPKRIESVIERLQEKPNYLHDLDQQISERLSHDGGLKLVGLEQFSQAQIRALLHRWLTRQGINVPSTDRLDAIIKDVINADVDRQPEVQIGRGAIRRHGLALYWVENQGEIGEPPKVIIDQPSFWQGVGEVGLLSEQGQSPLLKKGLADLNWRLRTEGETIHPVGRSRRRDLKRLFQEYRHKPWLRDRTPLLFSGDQLIAVGDLFVDQEFVAADGDQGLRVFWQISKNEIE